MYSKTYFRQEKDQAVKLPVKWLALEALTEGVFSEKSDVVSFVDEHPFTFVIGEVHVMSVAVSMYIYAG